MAHNGEDEHDDHVSQRFDYVKYDSVSETAQAAFKKAFSKVTAMIEQLPGGRAQALALTKMEESYMWVGKSLRDEQMKRNRLTELNASRDPQPGPPESML